MIARDLHGLVKPVLVARPIGADPGFLEGVEALRDLLHADRRAIER